MLSCLSGTPIDASAAFSPARPSPASDSLLASPCGGADMSSTAVMVPVDPIWPLFRRPRPPCHPAQSAGTTHASSAPSFRPKDSDGTRVPYSATGGGITRPRRPFEGSPREPPDGRLAGPHGPGVAFRHPRIGDFCSRFALIAPHDPPSREAAVASALRRPAG